MKIPGAIVCGAACRRVECTITRKRNIEPSDTNMTFDELDLPEEVRTGLREVGFTQPTPIQELSLRPAIDGKDVAGQAQTGTGKTAAFLLAIFTRLLRTPSKKPGLPRALVLAPTRELALQIHRDAEALGAHTGLSMTVVFGGMDYQKQQDEIRTGADIVIATPGRLMDYYRKKILILSNIEIVVVDEADRMFDMGFIKDIRFILRRLPPFDQRQSMLFSATLSYNVMELAYEHMNMPVEVSVEPERVTAEGIVQSLFHVSGSEKFLSLLRLLEREKPSRSILFSNTKGGVEMVARRLTDQGYQVGVLSGDIPQKKRLKIVKDFMEGHLQFLVATDVASRGLHVEDVSHVFNYDLPFDAEDYVHRIGRTGRAGATGKAFALVDEDSAFRIEAVEKYLGQKIPVEWADDLPEVVEKPYSRPPRREFSDRRGGPGGRDRRDGGGRGRSGDRGRRPDRGPRGDRPRDDRPREDRPPREAREPRETGEAGERRPAPQQAAAGGPPRERAAGRPEGERREGGEEQGKRRRSRRRSRGGSGGKRGGEAGAAPAEKAPETSAESE